MEDTVATDTALVEQRLSDIVQALSARHVGSDGEELWFEPDRANGLQVRLSGNRQARCYDRSANFAVSYGGRPSSEPVPVEFRNALERIKAIDHSPIDGAATAFHSASQAVAHRFAAAPGVQDGRQGDRPEPDAGSGAPVRSDRDGLAPVIEGQAEPVLPQSGSAIRTVVIVGGGTAGYFAALALKRAFPDVDVTLIESSQIPIIGVGEATTTLMPPFLHWQLGIDIVELYREVRPTWKLGIKFDWGLPGDYSFIYPFGDGNPVEAYAHDGHIANQSLCSLMMAAGRAPIVTGDDGEPISLLEDMPFAYHLENKSLVAYLQTCARRAGILHIDAEITDVAVSADGGSVDRLILDDGRVIRSDLYVDASGFRSLLMEKTLRSPFISFAPSLFCDGAIVGEIPQDGAIEPYTTAQTMDAGWCWRIPVYGEDHYGYVYSSAHLTVDQARAEMRASHPRLGDTWTVRFRSGRHQEFWKGNT
ncbi:MAG: tryptophan 7-halogenase, partial [Thermoanaerobaculia bacterium]